MRQGRGVACLRAEPGGERLVTDVGVPEELDCHRPAEHLVGAAPDLAHTARRDPLVQPVPAAEQDTKQAVRVGVVLPARLAAGLPCLPGLARLARLAPLAPGAPLARRAPPAAPAAGRPPGRRAPPPP